MNQQQVKLVQQLKAKTAGLRFKILHSPMVTYQILRPLYKLSRASLLFILSGIYRNDKLTKLR